jgi:capsular exopolysaccharide synthesis family protein
MSRYEELQNMRAADLARQADYENAKVQYQRRVTIRDERRDSLNSLREQIEKMKILHDDPETPKVQSVGLAPVPLDISFPKWQLFFPTGFLLGFMLGVGFAFLVELLNDTVRTPADIGRYLHVPLLGVIPDSSEDYHVKGVNMFKVTTLAPYTVISEAYRKFRANIQLSESSHDSKTLLVSCGMAGDGKTSVASNLAMTLVASGNKVLIIVANFWKPSLHDIYSQDSDDNSGLGLSSYLQGQCGSDEIVIKSNVEGLDLISSGTSPSNPAELLSSDKMKRLADELRSGYDYIIIDGPPVLLVSDVKVLARNVDGSIVVFNASSTKRGAALRTLRELREVNAKVVGCVLFGTKALKGGYFNEQYKSYEKYHKAQLVQKA